MFASLTFRKTLLRLKPALVKTGGKGFRPSPMGTLMSPVKHGLLKLGPEA